ncbi:hypothetical protein PSC71_09175 [Devosia sp. J2-20]|nr:hypothetical protein [Devosia sp. J2-20]WDR00885.1 hypothetical protein PSC71_09175 [Devosia sp. J2-20]
MRFLALYIVMARMALASWHRKQARSHVDASFRILSRLRNEA